MLLKKDATDIIRYDIIFEELGLTKEERKEVYLTVAEMVKATG